MQRGTPTSAATGRGSTRAITSNAVNMRTPDIWTVLSGHSKLQSLYNQHPSTTNANGPADLAISPIKLPATNVDPNRVKTNY